jgi:hypothetical protein
VKIVPVSLLFFIGLGGIFHVLVTKQAGQGSRNKRQQASKQAKAKKKADKSSNANLSSQFS